MRLAVYKIIPPLLAIVLPGSLLADVMMTIRDGEGQASQVMSDGQRVRIQVEGDPTYMIMDMANSQMLMVDTQRGEVIQINLGKGGSSSGIGIDIDLREKGGGPKIAGYETKQYRFFANGEKCGTVYASKKLLKNSDVRGLFESMQTGRRGMTQQMGGGLSLCDQGTIFLSDALEEAGMPMRIIDRNGQIESDVVKVRTDVNVPSSHYEAPAGMTQVDMQQKMQETMQQSDELMQQMPDMDELMQQLEQSGQEIPDESREQLKQLQQQLQQMQQQ